MENRLALTPASRMKASLILPAIEDSHTVGEYILPGSNVGGGRFKISQVSSCILSLVVTVGKAPPFLTF